MHLWIKSFQCDIQPWGYCQFITVPTDVTKWHVEWLISREIEVKSKGHVLKGRCCCCQAEDICHEMEKWDREKRQHRLQSQFNCFCLINSRVNAMLYTNLPWHMAVFVADKFCDFIKIGILFLKLSYWVSQFLMHYEILVMQKRLFCITTTNWKKPRVYREWIMETWQNQIHSGNFVSVRNMNT